MRWWTHLLWALVVSSGIWVAHGWSQNGRFFSHTEGGLIWVRDSRTGQMTAFYPKSKAIVRFNAKDGSISTESIDVDSSAYERPAEEAGGYDEGYEQGLKDACGPVSGEERTRIFKDGYDRGFAVGQRRGLQNGQGR